MQLRQPKIVVEVTLWWWAVGPSSLYVLNMLTADSCANYAVIHGLCAMTKQQYAARSGSPHDDESADSWKFTEQ